MGQIVSSQAYLDDQSNEIHEDATDDTVEDEPMNADDPEW